MCVLKVECRSIHSIDPRSILKRHSIITSVNTRSTLIRHLGRQSVESQRSRAWYACILRVSYSYRKEKETHELIFSWLTVLLVGLYARRRERRGRRATPVKIGRRHIALVYSILFVTVIRVGLAGLSES